MFHQKSVTILWHKIKHTKNPTQLCWEKLLIDPVFFCHEYWTVFRKVFRKTVSSLEKCFIYLKIVFKQYNLLNKNIDLRKKTFYDTVYRIHDPLPWFFPKYDSPICFYLFYFAIDDSVLWVQLWIKWNNICANKQWSH